MGKPYVELLEAFSEAERERALLFLQTYYESEIQSFTPISREKIGGNSSAEVEFEWLTAKMLELASAANKEGCWELESGPLVPTDDMTYDRFGPSYSDKKFDWHCDDGARGPRDISLVAYFTEPEVYEGGTLQLDLSSVNRSDPQTPGDDESCESILERRFRPGDAVAFPSKTLRHRVTPVTAGERRSLLMLCASGNSISSSWSVPGKRYF